jgi:hypothetical protein
VRAELVAALGEDLVSAAAVREDANDAAHARKLGMLQYEYPKAIRHRLLHTAARTSPRRLRLDTTWPWALDLLDAIDRLKTRLQPPPLTVPVRPAVTLDSDPPRAIPVSGRPFVARRRARGPGSPRCTRRGAARRWVRPAWFRWW